MAGKTAHPEKVNPAMARQALANCDQRGAAYTQYILLRYKATGQLAPGCDARDLMAWYEANMPAELAAKTKKRAQ